MPLEKRTGAVVVGVLLLTKVMLPGRQVFVVPSLNISLSSRCFVVVDAATQRLHRRVKLSGGNVRIAAVRSRDPHVRDIRRRA